jgi:hypothetical protein
MGGVDGKSCGDCPDAGLIERLGGIFILAYCRAEAEMVGTER